MFKKLFGKKEVTKTVELVAPLTGTVIDLSEVPDPVFAEKMMGDGIAINPTEGVVVAPVDAEVMQVFPTKHAIGLKAANGAEILIHIGLESVALKGEGFTTHISEGDRVKAGDTLVTYDLNTIAEKAKSTVTPVIITNGDAIASLEKPAVGEVERGTSPILKVTAK
ncbi:PTS glucose transporter subunit IIA [Bacillaceae bacterium Marseille-Q3522]|nr:PTS glucose transporter subunit IIA [Bacillaceae bacterium Marseille-Q3522]